MFQSVYDYPYLSSSANHIFDITLGMSSKSAFYSTTTVQKKKKNNVYNQLAQVLVGYDVTGSILRFDADGDFSGTTTDKLDDVVFLNFSRLLTKDEIKKDSFFWCWKKLFRITATIKHVWYSQFKACPSSKFNYKRYQ